MSGDPPNPKWREHIASCEKCPTRVLELANSGIFLPMADTGAEFAPDVGELKAAINQSDDVAAVVNTASWVHRLWVWLKSQFEKAGDFVKQNKLLLSIVALILIIFVGGLSAFLCVRMYKPSLTKRKLGKRVKSGEAVIEGIAIAIDKPKLEKAMAVSAPMITVEAGRDPAEPSTSDDEPKRSFMVDRNYVSDKDDVFVDEWSPNEDPAYDYYYDPRADDYGASDRELVTLRSGPNSGRSARVPRFNGTGTNWADLMSDDEKREQDYFRESAKVSGGYPLQPEETKAVVVASHKVDFCGKCKTLGHPCYSTPKEAVSCLSQHTKRCVEARKRRSQEAVKTITAPGHCLRCELARNIARKLNGATFAPVKLPKSPMEIGKKKANAKKNAPKKGKANATAAEAVIGNTQRHVCKRFIMKDGVLTCKTPKCGKPAPATLPERAGVVSPPPSVVSSNQRAVKGGRTFPADLPMTDCFIVARTIKDGAEVYEKVGTISKVGNGFQLLTHTMRTSPRATHIQVPHYNGLNNDHYIPLASLKFLHKRPVHKGGQRTHADGRIEDMDAEDMWFFLAPSQVKMTGLKMSTIQDGESWYGYVSGWWSSKQRHDVAMGPCVGPNMFLSTDYGCSGAAVRNADQNFSAVGLHMMAGRPGLDNILAPFKEEDAKWITGPFPNAKELEELQAQHPFRLSPGPDQ